MAVTQPKKFCQNCGYPLDGLPENRCPECGRTFSPTDPSTFKEYLGAPCRLYVARDAIEAHAVHSFLADRGIPSDVMGESLQLPGALPTELPCVWVGSEYLDRAKEALAAFLRAEREERDEHPDPLLGEPWTCPNCGERVEPQFTHCWNCQTPRPRRADSE